MLPVDKKNLRKEYFLKRSQLDADHLLFVNQQLLQQFQQLDFSKSRFIHIFLPILKNKEPDTFAFINFLQKKYPAIQIVVSKSNPLDATMQHFLYNQQTQLHINPWGIPEPWTGTSVQENQIDMVVIPLVVFDQKGNRIGYGKGFYDRFLSRCRPDVQKIGLSLFPPIESTIATDKHDVPLTACICPERIYYFA